jgi:tetratricopeptide (TPR) repeat protein
VAFTLIILNSDKTLQPSKFEERITRYSNENPRNPYALFSLGTLSKKIGNLDMANQYFLSSKNINPDFFKTRINLTNLTYEFGDSEGAKTEYKKLISQYPRVLSPYFNLSQIYTHESRYLGWERVSESGQKNRRRQV